MACENREIQTSGSLRERLPSPCTVGSHATVVEAGVCHRRRVAPKAQSVSMALFRTRVPGAVLVLGVETSSVAPAVSRHKGGGWGEAARNKRSSVKNVTQKMAHYFPCEPNAVAWPLGSYISGDAPAETGGTGIFYKKKNCNTVGNPAAQPATLTGWHTHRGKDVQK